MAGVLTMESCTIILGIVRAAVMRSTFPGAYGLISGYPYSSAATLKG